MPVSRSKETAKSGGTRPICRRLSRHIALLAWQLFIRLKRCLWCGHQFLTRLRSGSTLQDATSSFQILEKDMRIFGDVYANLIRRALMLRQISSQRYSRTLWKSAVGGFKYPAWRGGVLLGAFGSGKTVLVSKLCELQKLRMPELGTFIAANSTRACNVVVPKFATLELMVVRAHALSLERETLLKPYFKARRRPSHLRHSWA